VLRERVRERELGTSCGRELELRRPVAYLQHEESLEAPRL
jgi:hypothetical protein